MSMLFIGTQEQLENQLARETAAAKRDNPFQSVAIVVENNLAGVYLRRSLAELQGSHCRIRFVTLDDLASELSRTADEHSTNKTLPFYGEEWVASLVALEDGAKCYFKPVSESRGFSSVLLQFFRELEENNLDRVPAAEQAEPDRIKSLQALYDSYQTRLKGYCTRKNCYENAIRALALTKPFKLILYGISMLSPLEKKLVFALINSPGFDTTVLWPSTAGRFQLQNEQLQWYRQCGISVQDLCMESGKESKVTNLLLLQQNLFRPAYVQRNEPAKDESLTFLSVPDELQEVREITREILKLARNGVKFKDIAVLTPDSAYAYQCSAFFKNNGIPFYHSDGTSLAQTRPGRSFLLFLDLADSEFPRRQVMELISYAPLSYLKQLDNGQTINTALWEQLSLLAGVIKGKNQWAKLIDKYRLRLENQEEIDQAEEQLREEYIANLEMMKQTLKLLTAAAGQVTVAKSWGDFSFKAEESLLRLLDPGKERDLIIALLKQLSFLDLLGGGFNYNSARQALHDMLKSASIPQGRFQRSGVNILPLALAGSLQFDYIFIPGLSDSTLPKTLMPDPLIPEVERKKLKGRLSLQSSKIQLDKFFFSIALTSARKKVIISWPRYNALSGREAFPSPFIYQCGTAILGRRTGLNQLNQLPGFKEIHPSSTAAQPQDAISAEEYDQISAAALLDPPAVREYLNKIKKELRVLIDADYTRRHGTLTPHQGLFQDGSPALRLLESRTGREEYPLAVTALEDYAACPYSYFLKNLLEVTIIEEPEELFALPPHQKGWLIHKVLELFYREASRQEILPVNRFPEESRRMLIDLRRDYFDNLEKTSLPIYYPLIWKQQRRDLEEVTSAYLEWEIETDPGLFRPLYFEKRFGFPAEPVSIELLPEGSDKLYLKGRIDRIDLADKTALIVDYKTGRKKEKENSLQGGLALQLPVYLMAAGELLKRPVTESDQARYYYLSARGVETVGFSAGNWPEKKAELQNIVGAIFKGMTSGYFFPYPGRNAENCRHCDYKTVCGPDVSRMINFIKAADPILKQFSVPDNGS